MYIYIYIIYIYYIYLSVIICVYISQYVNILQSLPRLNHPISPKPFQELPLIARSQDLAWQKRRCKEKLGETPFEP